MCSAHVQGPSAADLTAQAKIRTAAIAHFARDGFQKTNVRTIAATAGVSAGLVIHHFGSKEKLRAVCDDHVLRILTQRANSTSPAGLQELFGQYQSDPEEYHLHMRYMVRAIEEDTPAATTFVNTMVDESEQILRAGIADGSLRPSSDVRVLAVLSVLVSLTTLTMPAPLARTLGHEQAGPDLLRRIGLPMLEVFTRGMYADDSILKAAQAAWDDAQESPHPEKRDE
ncbi:TetR family transcriptional regulator [Nonomuraea sp. NPDC052116]|uniref:TetR/AcrR family transcriptional regulator n=1 Tax=Nonomuraea sp. NPDC052116 TaxID=3155665 RepID=UPI003412CC00